MFSSCCPRKYSSRHSATAALAARCVGGGCWGCECSTPETRPGAALLLLLLHAYCVCCPVDLPCCCAALERFLPLAGASAAVCTAATPTGAHQRLCSPRAKTLGSLGVAPAGSRLQQRMHQQLLLLLLQLLALLGHAVSRSVREGTLLQGEALLGSSCCWT